LPTKMQRKRRNLVVPDDEEDGLIQPRRKRRKTDPSTREWGKAPTLEGFLRAQLRPWERSYFSATVGMMLAGNRVALGTLRQFVRRGALVMRIDDAYKRGLLFPTRAEGDHAFLNDDEAPILGHADLERDQPVPKQIRETITSLDIEKDRSILSHIEIPPPWTVGLVINLADRFDASGAPLARRKKVKSLTIVFLTCQRLSEFERELNSPAVAHTRRTRKRRADSGRSVVRKRSADTLSRIRNRGFLKVVLAITGFPTFAMARDAFLCWKQYTRGPRSRINCGIVIWEEFRDVLCGELKMESTSESPSDAIRRLQRYTSVKQNE